MSGPFDAFLYVPATPPTTPSPTKKERVSFDLPASSPRLANFPARLEAPDAKGSPTRGKRKRVTRAPSSATRSLATLPPSEDEKSERVMTKRRRSPRLVSRDCDDGERGTAVPSPPDTPRTPASTESCSAEHLHPPCPPPPHAESTTVTTRGSKGINKSKRKKVSRPYADPSLYAHLPQSVPDSVGPNLTLLMVGLNPGVLTARTGAHFAHPTNLFWPLLFRSGIIPRPYRATESHLLPAECGLGITNLVSRPTAESGELSRAECLLGAGDLVTRVQTWRPKAIALTGKGIWEALFRHLHGRPLRATDHFAFGWQEETIVHSPPPSPPPTMTMTTTTTTPDSVTRIFVTVGTSGRVAAYSPAFKQAVFDELGRWVNEQRASLASTERSGGDDDDEDDDDGVGAGPVPASSESMMGLQIKVEGDSSTEQERRHVKDESDG